MSSVKQDRTRELEFTVWIFRIAFALCVVSYGITHKAELAGILEQLARTLRG